ncbi:MAG: recombinase family protein [Clostridium sp.]|nr:recombinase family protein [Clostridium sp.]
MAQDELRSILENSTWGLRRRYEQGKFSMSTKRFLGYDTDENGISNWHATTLQNMLENEKYMGNAVLQKSYTVDFLSKKRIKNDGQIQTYVIEENHEELLMKKHGIVFRWKWSKEKGI